MAKIKKVKAVKVWALVDSDGVMMGAEHQPRIFASADHAQTYKRITCCEEDQVIYVPIPVLITPLPSPKRKRK